MELLFYAVAISTGLLGLTVFYRASESGSKGQKIAALCYGLGAILAIASKSWIPLLVGWALTFIVMRKYGDPDRLFSPTLVQQYTQDAESGDAAAQFEMGVLHQYGKGVPQDFLRAISLYRKAAEQGHLGAQSNLGILYASGIGITRDYGEALHWFTKAANQGDAFAQNNLCRLYSFGEGVSQDYVTAYMWLELAIGGLEGAQKEKAEMNRDKFLASHMNSEEIERAKRMVVEWKANHRH